MVKQSLLSILLVTAGFISNQSFNEMIQKNYFEQEETLREIKLSTAAINTTETIEKQLQLSDKIKL